MFSCRQVKWEQYNWVLHWTVSTQYYCNHKYCTATMMTVVCGLRRLVDDCR